MFRNVIITQKKLIRGNIGVFAVFKIKPGFNSPFWRDHNINHVIIYRDINHVIIYRDINHGIIRIMLCTHENMSPKVISSNKPLRQDQFNYSFNVQKHRKN